MAPDKKDSTKFSTIINKAKDTHIGDIYNYDLSSLLLLLQDRLPWITDILPLGNRKKERQNRKALLDSVHRTWVGDFSDRDIPLKLGLKKRLDLVESALTPASKLQERLPPDTRIIDLFDSEEMGYQLLILGNPGAGKSTALRELAKDLIDRAKGDEELPIPVAFYLPRWNPKQSLEKWIINEFSSNKYPTSEPTNRRWLKNEKLLFLLEGLDEVRGDRQAACVEAINKFIDDYKLTKIIVFSRLEEYEKLDVRLQFHSALLIKPLKKEQVYEHLQYLQSSGMNLQGILSALQSDPQLLKLAKTPLFLSIISKAYEGVEVERLPPEQNHEEHVQYLFERYVDRMTEPNQNQIRHPEPNQYPDKNKNHPDSSRNRWSHKQNKLNPTYSKEETIAWLQFLARNIPNNMFLIEEINPTWLPPTISPWLYRLSVGLYASLFMMFYGLLLGLVKGQLSLQMTTGLVAGLVLGTIISMESEITLFDSIYISLSMERAIKKAKQVLFRGTPLILLTMVSLSVLPSFQPSFSSALIAGVFISLLATIICGLVAGIFQTKPRKNDAKVSSPNLGIRRSAIKFISATVVSIILIFLLTLWSNLTLAWSILGCIGLYFGGFTCFQHMAIFTLLWETKNVPWKYTNFLNYARECSLIKCIGGNYSFIHNLLHQNLAFQEIQLKPIKKDYRERIIAGVIVRISCLIILFLISSTFNSMRITDKTLQHSFHHLQLGDRFLTHRISPDTRSLKQKDIVIFNRTPEIPKSLKTIIMCGEVVGSLNELVSIKENKVATNKKNQDSINNFDLSLINAYLSKYSYEILPSNVYLIAAKINDGNEKSRVIIPVSYIKEKIFLQIWPRARFI